MISAKNSSNLVTGVIYYYRLFRRHTGWRLELYSVLAFFRAVSESLGIAMLIPLFDLAGNPGASGEDSAIGRIFESVGIGYSLTSALVVFAVVGLLRVVFQFCSDTVCYHVSYAAQARMRIDLASALNRASYRYYTTRPSGFFNSMISSESIQYLGAFRQYIKTITFIIFSVIFLCSMIAVNPAISLFGALAGVIATPLLARNNKQRKGLSARISDENATSQSLFIQFLSHFKYFKATGSHAPMAAQLKASFNQLYRLQFQNALGKEIIRGILQLTIVIAVVATLVVVVKVQGQPMSAALVLLLLVHRIMTSVMGMQENWNTFCSNTGPLHALENVREELEENEETFGGEAIQAFERDIALQGVNMDVDDGRRILSDINVTIQRNETLGIVGPSGAGKSTLVDLITGVLTPSNGCVKIDGRDYQDIDLRTLRALFGYVTQQPVVFNDTILNNVSLWEDVPPEELEKALHQSHSDEFIGPDGRSLEDMIGDRGVRLSGGQIQRIAIARELLKHPPILIFDEATSALDSKAEKFFQESLSELKRRATILLIAHRLDTVRLCDRILVMDQGRIVEEGTWAELITTQGSMFQDLCAAQGVFH